ncbi:MAG: STAS domain-containing protein [Candidatus Hydrogenedens sp.]|jgi:anti-anti-sigma factor|nr:STAS domain-containing protein [Candidatus Hydrogenedens sp.]
MLTVEQRINGKVTILDIAGEIDQLEAPKMRELVSRSIDEKRFNLVLNLQRVQVIDYASFGVLLEMLGELQRYGGGLKFACANLHTRRMLRLMGLYRVLECFDTEAAAIQEYHKEAA